MRTTLNLDDDVLAAARLAAKAEGKSLGTKVSEWARVGMTCDVPGTFATRNGIPLLPARGGRTRVDMACVHRLRDEAP